MSELEDTVATIAAAAWSSRVALVRTIPEKFGTAQHADVYAAIATQVYAPHLVPDFGYVHWRSEYELPIVEHSYRAARELTGGFTETDVASLAAALETAPHALLTFRLLLGFSRSEFAAATQSIASSGGSAVGTGRVKGMEEGRSTTPAAALACAIVIDAAMRRTLFPAGTRKVRSKQEKPDTLLGWQSVQDYAMDGVPLSVYLHQRMYGGSFRQLLDATSGKRGDVLEDAVEDIFISKCIPYVRTVSDNQEEISKRFGLTVKPSPDFAIHDSNDTLRAILECKGANDGGTARDKAARFRALRSEATRLGGIPVFAVLSGLGWRRARDALGPVVRDTDGRVFTIATLGEIVHVEPLPQIAADTPT